MARRTSKAQRFSEQLEKEEEQKARQRKTLDERELRRLARQARLMKESKLKDAAVEKNTKVKNIIISENNNLNSNLMLMKSKSRCVSDTKQAQNIANLFAQGDDLDAAIAQEKHYLADLESQIRRDTKAIQAVKKKKGDSILFCSEYLLKKENERASRTLESWKSRLAAEQTQLALITKDNEEMRKKIRRLLKEKGQFNELYEELMKKLKKGKRVMTDIVEMSRQKFQKRDEVSRKIEALRSRDKADLAKRMEEMQDMEKRLFEDHKLAEFRHRVQIVREKLIGGIRSSTRATYEQDKLTKRLQRAHEYWEQLQEATGLSTAEDIAKYIRNEDSSLFSLFTFNTEIRDQLEVMTQKAANLVNQVDEEQNLAEDRIDQETKARNMMEKKLEVLDQTCNDMSDHYDANNRMFSRLLDKIKMLFDLLKCSSSVLEDLLGNNKEVTEHNYRLYLGLVENKTIEALDFLNLAFPATSTVNHALAATKSMTFTTSRTVTKVKSTVSVVDKRVITNMCWDEVITLSRLVRRSSETKGLLKSVKQLLVLEKNSPLYFPSQAEEW